jgi:hypothetical protein
MPPGPCMHVLAVWLLILCVWAPGTLGARTLVTLTSKGNGQYVRREADNTLIPSKSGVSTWEVYEQVSLSDGTVAFKALANSQYVSVQGGDVLTATAGTVGLWEKFKVTNTPDGYQFLESLKNSAYVSAPGGGTQPLVANAPQPADAEKFVVSIVIDAWEVMTAFANNFPNQAKLRTVGPDNMYGVFC